MLAAAAWLYRRAKPADPPYFKPLGWFALFLVIQGTALMAADVLLHWLRDHPDDTGKIGLVAWTLWGIQALRAVMILLAAAFWLRIFKSQLKGKWRKILLIIAFLFFILIRDAAFIGTILLVIVLLKTPWTSHIHGWRRFAALLLCAFLMLLLFINVQTGSDSGGGVSWGLSSSPSENLLSGDLPPVAASAVKLSTPWNGVVRVLGHLLRLQLLIATFQLLVYPIRLRGLSLKRRFTVTTILYRVIPGFLGFVVLVLGAYFGLGLHKTRLAQEAFNHTLDQNLAAAGMILEAGREWPDKTSSAAVSRVFERNRRWNTQAGAGTHYVLKKVGLRTAPADSGEVAEAEIDTVLQVLSSPGTPATFCQTDLYNAGAVDTVMGMITADAVLYLAAARSSRNGDTALVAEVYTPMDSLYVSGIARLVAANVTLRARPNIFLSDDGVQYGGAADSAAVDTSFSVYAPVSGPSEGDGFWHKSRFLAKAFLPLSNWREELAGGVTGAMELTLSVAPGRLARGIVSSTIVFTSNAIAILIFAAILLLFLIAETSAARTGRSIIRGILDDVKELAGAARRFGEGDLAHRIDVRGKDELGSLRSSFNTMAENIEQNQELLLEKERLEADLAVARDIQQRLLPQSPPVLPGLDMAGISIPSREVGGDLFYFLPVPEGRLGLTIGDVSGKSVPAALLMSNVLAALKTEARLVEDEHEILSHLNNLIAEQVEPGRFVTFFYGVIDREKQLLSYACAGHNPTLKMSADGTAEWLSEAGVPLGVLPENVYVPAEASLALGDVIVLYSDGVTEAERPQPGPAPAAGREEYVEDKGADDPETSGEPPEAVEEPDFFEEHRLEQAVRDARHLSASEIVQVVVDAVREFTGGADLSDDLTLVVVKIIE